MFELLSMLAICFGVLGSVYVWQKHREKQKELEERIRQLEQQK